MLHRLSREEPRVLMTLDAVGGVWRYSMDLAASMVPQGFDFIFVGSGPQPSAAQRQEALALGQLVWLDAPLDWLVEDERDLDVLTIELEKLAREVDLLHLNAPSQAAGLTADTPKLVVSHSCVPTWFQAVESSPCPPRWAWQRPRNRAGLTVADAIVSPSGSHADAIASCYGALDTVTVVHNGTAESGGHTPKQPLVMSAGRWWDEGKNGKALDAAAEHVPWPVQMAGATEGPAGQMVQFEHVQALGSLSAPDVRTLLNTAAIVTSPSIYEPFGLVPLEGAKAGAALVLSDIPTYRELWDGVAYFADPYEPSRFSEAINALIANPDERHVLGQRARERAEAFTLDRQAKAMAGLYRSLTHQHAI